MSTLDLTLSELGLKRPPLEAYRKTLWVAVLALLALLLVFLNTSAEEEEGLASNSLTMGVVAVLVGAFLFETVLLVDSKVKPCFEGMLVCRHCHHRTHWQGLKAEAMERNEEAQSKDRKAEGSPEGLVVCEGCGRSLEASRATVRVNYGSLLTALRLPKLVERLGWMKLEYQAWVGEAPRMVVGGDLIRGDKIDIRDSVVDRSSLGSPEGPQQATQTERTTTGEKAGESGADEEAAKTA